MAQKFKPLRVIETLFTGGQVIRNGDYLFLNGGETLSIYHLGSKALQKLETGVISCFCVSPNAEFLVVALKSLIIEIYRLEKGGEGDVELKLPLLFKFKAHEAPILVMDFDPSSTLFATGSADSTIKVWDVQNGFATHNFKGHSGVVSAIKFHPKLLILASGSDDCKVRVWDLNSKKCLAVLDFHVSIVRGLDFHENYLFSASRDQMFTKWDLNTKKSEFSIPAYESLEACAVVTYNGTRALCTAGEAGIIKLWGLDDGELLDQQEKDKNSPHNIQGLTLWRDDLIAFTGDQNIWFFNLIDGIQRTAQIAGYSEEILDLSLVAGGTRLAVATNTEQIRVYDLKTFDCDIIYGHADIVLAIATSFDGNFLATGSKDHTAKIWQVNYDCKEKNQRIREYHTFTGHTSSVTTVAFGKCTNTWFLTGSQDRTIKCWHFDSKKLGSSRYTILGHEKDIQSIDISPNEAWFVSASLDKTAKVFYFYPSYGKWKMARFWVSSKDTGEVSGRLNSLQWIKLLQHAQLTKQLNYGMYGTFPVLEHLKGTSILF